MNMAEKIKHKLESNLHPTELRVINESHLHAGHAGDDGSGESHFKIEIMSSKFDPLNRVARERLIYEALSDEMRQIHALSIKIL